MYLLIDFDKNKFGTHANINYSMISNMKMFLAWIPNFLSITSKNTKKLQISLISCSSYRYNLLRICVYVYTYKSSSPLICNSITIRVLVFHNHHHLHTDNESYQQASYYSRLIYIVHICLHYNLIIIITNPTSQYTSEIFSYNRWVCVKECASSYVSFSKFDLLQKILGYLWWLNSNLFSN